MDGKKPLEEFVRRKRNKRAGLAVWMLILILLVLLPPLYLAGPVQQLTALPVFWARLLCCAVWATLLYVLGWLLFTAVRRYKLRKGIHQHPKGLFDDALDALDSIAQGNYDVIIESDNDRFRYGELVERINNLARQLCSVEQMRQDFVSNVSHEIRSPLTSIAGFAKLLESPDLPEEERMHYLDVIQSETERMFKLSDHLLRLSMLDNETTTLNVTTFRLDRQLEDILLAQEPQWAGKDIELDVALQEASCAADEELLGQVWQNLLQNAIKFTPKGGHVSVALQAKEGTICCTVKDDGIGLAPEDQLHIFDRFYKVDKARERSMGGNGLGLPLAKRIVELHDGQIHVESTPGEGSTFTVCLPCSE